MSALACTEQDIFILNQTKEYTATNTYLLESVLTAPELTPGAKALWQFIYSRARFDKKLSIQLSYEYLARHFVKSTRTVQRYVKQLRQSGYLLVMANFNGEGGQWANTFLVRFPEKKIQSAKLQKDRNGCSHGSAHGSETKKSAENFDPSEIRRHAPEKPKVADKIVVGEGDNAVVHNKYLLENNNNNNLNTETTAVVVLDEDKNAHETSENTQKLLTLMEKVKRDRDIAEQRWLSEKTNALKYDLSKTFSELDAYFRQLQLQLEREQNKTKSMTQQQAVTSELISDNRYVANLPGKRTVSEFSHKRLVKNVHDIVQQRELQTKIINEIMFETRFGSLIKNNKTGGENTIDRSINVGLKLVREGRWSTPVGMLSFLRI